MKNRLTQPRKSNGKFWCSHVWVPIGKYGPDWDIRIGVKILRRCSFCGKLKAFSNLTIKEIPEELIDETIKYF